MTSTAANRKQPFGRKHVPSTVPASGPRDLSRAVGSHRNRGDATLTTQAAQTAATGTAEANRDQRGGPQTVGRNPNPPAKRKVSANDALTSGTPAASTQATSFPPYGGNY